MKNNLIKSVEDLKFICIGTADTFKEVSISAKLPESIEKEHELSDYCISVYFHNEG